MLGFGEFGAIHSDLVRHHSSVVSEDGFVDGREAVAVGVVAGVPVQGGLVQLICCTAGPEVLRNTRDAAGGVEAVAGKFVA